MVEEMYEVYKKKYKLPLFKDLDAEFELSTIELPDFFLRQVKKKIKEKLQDLSEIFSEILNPSSESLVQLSQCKIFDVEEKNKIYELFRQIQYYIQVLHESEYINDEKKDAELINEINKDWPHLKTKALVYLGKLKEHWKKEINLKETLEYFG